MTKIIVIEDEQAIRELLSDILAEKGYAVIEAANGKEGVTLAIAEIPDLIICDIMMPEMDGYDVLNYLRKNPATVTIPVIFLTAKGTHTDIRQGMKLGADDYLVKPFDEDELIEAIAARLEKQKAIEAYYQKEIDELRSNITLSLPHEMRTPLTGIVGASAFLIETLDSLDRDTILTMLDSILISGKRLHELVNKYLLYINLEQIAKNPTEVKKLRSKSVEYVKDVITETALNGAYRFNRETDLKLKLEDGELKINQNNLSELVNEVIDNAFKFSQSGSLVEVSSTIKKYKYIISVSDQGRGMTATQIAKIGAYMQFEREKYEQQGSGLGLIIVKRIVELFGGNLTIESVPNQFTTVRVSLPLIVTSAQ